MVPVSYRTLPHESIISVSVVLPKKVIEYFCLKIGRGGFR